MPRCRSYQPIYVSKKKATRARKTIFVCSLPEITSSDVRIFVFHLSIWTTLHRQEKKEYKKYTKEEKMVVGYPQPHGYLLMFLPSWRGTRCQIYVHTFFFLLFLWVCRTVLVLLFDVPNKKKEHGNSVICLQQKIRKNGKYRFTVARRCNASTIPETWIEANKKEMKQAFWTTEQKIAMSSVVSQLA